MKSKMVLVENGNGDSICNIMDEIRRREREATESIRVRSKVIVVNPGASGEVIAFSTRPVASKIVMVAPLCQGEIAFAGQSLNSQMDRALLLRDISNDAARHQLAPIPSRPLVASKLVVPSRDAVVLVRRKPSFFAKCLNSFLRFYPSTRKWMHSLHILLF